MSNETIEERKARWRSVSVAPSATPSRAGGAEAKRINSTEKAWHKDMGAYKRLRNDGLQPKGIDGCATLESQATDPLEVEVGDRQLASDLRRVADGTLEIG